MSRRGRLPAMSALGGALRLLARERSLWLWAALPALVNGVALALAIGMFFGLWLDPVSASLGERISVGDPGAWYGWLWVGPLRALAWMLRGLLLVAFAVGVYFAFSLFGGVLAAPFLDVLSRRVERLRTGGVLDVSGAGVGGAARSTLRSIGWEARRVGLFISIQVTILALGLVPGLQPVAAVAAIAVAASFLPLDYTGYLFDRRGIPFRERRRWLWQHRGSVLPFGLAGLATFAVPVFNFLCLPWLVTAGTLLALEVGPPATANPDE